MTQSTPPQASTKSAGIETFSIASSSTSSTQTSYGRKLIEEYKAAYAAYKLAEARWKQAQEAVKQGHHDGDLGEFFDQDSGVYVAEGLQLVPSATKSWPISGFSKKLQDLHTKEKADGTAQPNISVSLRAKWLD